MACQDCDDAQEAGTGAYYFRWKNANVAFIGCRQHVQEIFVVLREHVSKPQEPDPSPPAAGQG